MMLAEPLRLACPRCGATLYQRQLWSGNTLGARYYSDRKREAPMLPSFPSFSKCPKCGELFWVRDLKPSEDPDAPQWGPSEAYLEMIDLEDSVRFLEEKNETGLPEFTVRTQIWRLYNDRVRYRVDQRTRAENEAALWKSDADKERWRKNLERIDELTKEIAPDDATFATANGSPSGTTGGAIGETSGEATGGATGGAQTLRLNAIARCYLVEPRDKPKREIVAPSEQTPFPKCAYITGWLDGPRTVNMLTTLPGAALVELGYDEASRRSERIVRNHWSWLQSQPGFENYELVEIAPMLGIRESYRVKTSYVLVEADLAAGWNAQQHDDMIAVADHPCDIHGEGGTLSSVKTAYGVPFRCLIPATGPRNLLVACRGAGFSKIAASSCRLQRTMIQLGNAAGLAAAWAARDGVPVDAVDVGALTEKLDVRSRYPGLR